MKTSLILSESIIPIEQPGPSCHGGGFEQSAELF
jgi:hypothetical protein